MNKNFFLFCTIRSSKTNYDHCRWLDGFSTFYVNDEGLVVRHIADKVMPDEDKHLNPIEKAVDKLSQTPLT